jgi:hypothetical protein
MTLNRAMFTRVLLLLLFLGSGAGCTGAEEISDVPVTIIPEGDVNQTLLLSAPAGLNNFVIGDPLQLTLELTVEHVVIFYYEDVSIYGSQNGDWVEIPNRIDPNSMGGITNTVVYPNDVPALRTVFIIRRYHGLTKSAL